MSVMESGHQTTHLRSSSPINNEKSTATMTSTTANTNAPSSESIAAYLTTLPEYKSTPRMQSLYSDLSRQKASNPGGYTANLGWWRNVLVELVRRRLQPGDAAGDALVLRADQELSDALRVERVGRPAGLGTAIIEAQVAQIENSITTRTTQIKAALLASRQEIAKIQLKSRNALQALLTQRLGTLTTLTTSLNSIDQAHGDAAILKAYQGSARVLKEIMSKPEMQEERVGEVMDDLREQMENAEGVRRAVEEGGWEVVEAAGQGVDDDEITKELAALELPTVTIVSLVLNIPALFTLEFRVKTQWQAR
ncbi:hypothetical protein M408DRAFT_312477 [Serendipita vermifera MAFF 305830]|uniref:Uncharacterized protein n=1 Tax=Serendipita vermifera MAFF 305830 TaxID=933852 RepID=A0A0C3B3I2_SERVB|nr:hypothetical protein M408DRAFT_312477 [Serendipita vermifera MAFF 305830]